MFFKTNTFFFFWALLVFPKLWNYGAKGISWGLNGQFSELSRIPLIILIEENMKGKLSTQGGDACLPLHSLLWFPL